METSNLLRHQIITKRVAQTTEKVDDAAISLWAKMATQIILIVGEGGFNSLYARSIFLTQSTFPWLLSSPQPPPAEHRFEELKLSLAGQTPERASEANKLLLITFTDILASLIGEQLTIRILRSAWGNDVQNQADKGVQK